MIEKVSTNSSERTNGEKPLKANKAENKTRKPNDRVLGDEWLDWKGSQEPHEIREGVRTYLILGLLVVVFLIVLAALFWYLVLPRFEQYGRISVAVLTVSIAAFCTILIVWYSLLTGGVLSRRFYLAVCLNRGRKLFFTLFPLVSRIAIYLGISRDRIGHSFIEVSNRLAEAASSEGTVLALIPRCLSSALKREIKSMCANYKDVVLHTAPGGTEARNYIREIRPKAIIAVACERDLMGGIHEVAPKIPVIGIPNSRPFGPCKDTSIDIDRFREALDFFCKASTS